MSTSPEAIAIIGMACRLPGDIASDQELWDFLCNDRSAQGDVPSSRFNIDGFHNPQDDLPNTIPLRGGYFIREDLRLFENTFFGINKVEAMTMDPQQRKLLEVTFECLESAGLTLGEVSGANIGCYVANDNVDYQNIMAQDPGYLPRLAATGSGTAILANRISNIFNLKGPSLSLNTACSSSLYCLHLAVQALRRNECASALVAGVNLIQSYEQHMYTARLGVLSKNSTCHPFASSADGYGRADGVGALCLKRLSDAVRDGDPIRCVIRGTAVNNNGKTPGITMPSTLGQQDVINRAYLDAGIDPRYTSYVECHGTGTQVGDPIEVAAVAGVFGGLRAVDGSHAPMLIGSVKSNLGHSEAASGITSIIKVALALERGWIPATIGANQLNPSIDWEHGNVQVVRKGTPWPKLDGDQTLRRAGVNSFGFGGSNAHCILEGFDAERHPPLLVPPSSCEVPVLLPLSAASEFSLRKRFKDLTSTDTKSLDLRDLAHTLINRRSRLDYRACITVTGSAWPQSVDDESFKFTFAKSFVAAGVPLVYVFTGQGALWAAAGKQLYQHFEVFRRRIDDLDRVLTGTPEPPNVSLKSLITESNMSGVIHLPQYSQPACTAIQIALVDLLEEWGLLPTHVIGEIAAAYASGYLDAAAAIRIAHVRGVVLSTSETPGAMMAAGMSETEADVLIGEMGLSSRLRVACVNSPDIVTFSGDESAVHELLSELTRTSKFARLLKTGGKAYHSHHMEALGSAYGRYLETAIRDGWRTPSAQAPRALMISSVHAKIVHPAEVACATYWQKNLERPVLFKQAIELLPQLDRCQIIEIGPHSALQLPIKQIISRAQPQRTQPHYLPTISRYEDSARCLLRLASQLWCSGVPLDLGRVNRSVSAPSRCEQRPRAIHKLPRYPWCYDEPLWTESRISAETRRRKFSHDELLGLLVPGMNGITFTWRNILRLKDVKWLKDHKLGTQIVVPGAAYIDMALKALQQVKDVSGEGQVVEVRDLRISHALRIDQTDAVELFTELQAMPLSGTQTYTSRWTFLISTFSNGHSVKHATGSLSLVPIHDVARTQKGTSMNHREVSQGARNWYQRFAEVGLNFGSSFQTLDAISTPCMREARSAQVRLRPRTIASDPFQDRYSFRVHPTVIDALFQACLIATSRGNLEEFQAQVPTAIGCIRFFPGFDHDRLNSYQSSTRARRAAAGVMLSTSEMVDRGGNPLIEICDFETTFLPISEPTTATLRYPLSTIEWLPDLNRIKPQQGARFAVALGQKHLPLIEDVPNSHEVIMSMRLLLMAGMLRSGSSVLDISREDRTKLLWALLEGGARHPLCESVSSAHWTEDGQLMGNGTGLSVVKASDTNVPRTLTDTMFDIILMAGSDSKHLYQTLQQNLRPHGMIIYNGEIPSDAREDPRFDVIAMGTNQTISIVRHSQTDGNRLLGNKAGENEPRAVVITSSESTTFDKKLSDALATWTGARPLQISLAEVSADKLPARGLAIVTAELERSVLPKTTADELRAIQLVMKNASRLLWAVGGDVGTAPSPKMAAALGLLRAVAVEQPTLECQVLGLETPIRDVDEAIDCLHGILVRPAGIGCDNEFLFREGLLHVSRCVPHRILNGQFQEKKLRAPKDMELRAVELLELDIGSAGQFNTMHFVQRSALSLGAPDDVEIEVRAIGINAKDVYTLSGKVNTQRNTFSLECAGVIRKIGAQVTHLAVGDRVVVAAPQPFATSVVVPEWACVRLHDNESFTQMATAPIAYMTALHALVDRARLQSGESVLIHSAAGGVGMAAIRVAQAIGATVYATVGTQEKRDTLVQEFDIPPQHIFHSRDTSFLQGVLRLTESCGVDVVLNSLTGERLHAGIEACSDFGRFIEIGKRDITDLGKLSLAVFERGLTISAFDLSEYFYSSNPANRRTFSRLMREAIEVFRSLPVKAVHSFDVSRLHDAMRSMSNANRVGKISVSLEDPNALVPVLPKRHKYRFSSTKYYLLVGCLGGLGRSLARYLFENGARHFVFLGRTGTDKPAAKALVDDLRSRCASVQVVRGDVQDYAATLKAVEGASLQLGGVVHAAMTLSEALFENMTNDRWHACLGPKIQGAWNLHRAIEGRDSDLDFFLMASSRTGSIGAVTESNYCAANSYLDHFAHYRRSLGRPALSIGLGAITEVGYLHEHPDVEARLHRGGYVPITEADLLDICDIALCSSQEHNNALPWDRKTAHLLVGLEASPKGFQGPAQTEMADPRFSILLHAEKTGRLTSLNDPVNSDAILPTAVSDSVNAKDRDTLKQVVLGALAGKLSELVLTAKESITTDTTLSSVGIDSMLAAEFRAFIFFAFKVEVPLLALTDPTSSMRDIVTLIAKTLLP